MYILSQIQNDVLENRMMPLLKNLSLNNWRFPWHLLFIFALLAEGILGVGFWYYGHQKAHFQREMEAQLSAIANLKVNQIVAWRQERMHDAMLIFDDPIFAFEVQQWFDGTARAGRREEIVHRLQGLKQNMYVTIRLLDSQGRVRLAIPETAQWMTPLVKEMAVEALASGKVIFSDLHFNPEKEIRLDLVVPIHFLKGGKKINVGNVILCVDPHQFLFPLLQSWPIPSKTAESVMVRREGNEIVFLNELRHRPGSALTLRLPLDRSEVPAVQAARGYEGIVRGIDYHGATVVAATRDIPGCPWFLTAKIDDSEVEAPLEERFQLVALILMALMATSGASVAYFWRNRDVHFYRQQVETKHEQEKVLRESEKQLRSLSSQLLMVQEKERQKISMELHDELGQALMVLKFQLQRISKEKKKSKAAEFQSLLHYLDGVIEKVRRLSRDLIPASLEQFGLSAAIQNLLEEVGKHVNVHWSPEEFNGIDQLFSSLQQVNIYRIFQESLTNIARHAQASQITVSIKKLDDHVLFNVEDNGQGFDLKQVWDREDREIGIGLTAMQERARLAGGFLILWSKPGAGTKITINIPIGEEEGNNAPLSPAVS
jgi:signal transduction histidine kinase